MKERIEFKHRIEGILDQIDPEVLAYNEDEFWMIQFPYECIQQHAYENTLMNTAIALPLARGIHNGTYRKSTITKFGREYKIPYVIHCIMVCKMLADLPTYLPKKEKDILFAAALCHDMIEDVDFAEEGRELVTDFHLDPEVYEIVKLLSKRKDFTDQEEINHFHAIESNQLAVMIKLSDRSHNVEDLYNMSVWKVKEYVGETKKFLLPMCGYSMEHYPSTRDAVKVLEDKINSLTECAEIMVERHESRIGELEYQIRELRKENEALRKEWQKLWEG